jgi:two-component system OmpR family response regulator
MANLILIDAERAARDELAQYLSKAGHDVRMGGNAAGLWRMLGERQGEVVVLDLGGVDEAGLSLVARLQKRYPNIGVLILGAPGAPDGHILGLQLGVDHFLPKPIAFRELAAQIDALCRRVRRQARMLRPSHWALRTTNRQLILACNQAIDLTEKEFKFLHLLVASTGPLSRDALLLGLGIDDDAKANKLNMLVYRLRRKVKAASGAELPVCSTYGSGYHVTAVLTLQ